MTFPLRVPLTAATAVRAVVALAAASAFAVPLLTALHTRVPGTRQRPLFEPKATDRLVAYEIAPTPTRAQSMDVHIARVIVQDVAALTSHQRILLMVAAYGTRPRLLRGELSFDQMACTYHTADDIEIADNYLVAFEREAECAPSLATGQGTLVFRLRENARIALATYVGSPPPRDALVLGLPGPPDRPTPIIQGEIADVYPGTAATRIELLSYVWDVRPGTRWLDLAIASLGMLIGCAVLLAWPAQPPLRFRAARQTAAALMAAFALSASYALLCPPFQVADEPSHFLAMTSYLGQPLLGDQAEGWAQRGMFEEIRFHPFRTFSPLDRGAPGRRWSEVSVPMRDLYGAVRSVWRPLGRLVSNRDLPRAFLTVRLYHAACFAVAAALFVLFVRTGAGSASAISAVLPLLLVPSIPQFGMHVSNYAPLLAAYTLLGAGIVIGLWDGRGSWIAGPILGFALGATIGISRSALPLLPLVAAVLAARAVLGDPAARRAAAWAFWVGFTLLLAATLTVLHMSYTNELDMYGGLVSPTATAFTVLLRQPWLLVPFGAAGLMSELLLTRARGAATFRPRPAAVRWTAAIAAIGLFVMLAVSLWVPYPTLPLYIMPHRPAAAEYVKQVVLACGTFLRFGYPDWLTSTSFFAGFGWLDVVPPIHLVSLIAGASGMMLVALIAWVAWARSARTLIWLAFAGMGFLVSAATYGLSIVRAVPSDLHGRYLIGLYLCALVICWSGLGRTAGSSSSGRYATLAALASTIAVNVYCLRLILARYFS